MADVLKEMKEAVADGVRRLIDENAVRKQIRSERPAQVFNALSGPSGGAVAAVPEVFTTGYTGTVTTVAFIAGFSPVDGTDVVTM